MHGVREPQEELEEDQAKKVMYILQLMWRDISSKYDAIGPYFTSSSGLDARLTAACLYETMGAMESVEFKIKAIVSNGASWNLSHETAFWKYWPVWTK